jgi:ABC-type multidrug transport system ATPase subunit
MAPPELRRRAVYVPQAPALGPVPVAENLRLGPAFIRCEADQDRIIQLLEMVKLPPEYATRNTRGLSGGEQYRVSLAMALALDPEVLLLDEPTANLDPELADHIGFLIRKLTGDSLAVIVVTHDMQLVKGLMGTYLFLDAGRTRASGALSSLDEDADTTVLWKRLATPAEEQ